jgi:hypothetical protein
VREAAHHAVRDATFLVELVLTVNVAAEDMIRIDSFQYAVLFWEVRAIGAKAQLARRARSRGGASGLGIAEPWQEWREGSSGLVTGLYAAEEARLLLERRYLDGHPALLPDAITDWERLRDGAERLASLVNAQPPLLVGRRRAPRSAEIESPGLDLDVLRSGARARAPAMAARLVGEARAATLDFLGDVSGAISVAALRMQETASQDPCPA